MRCLNSTASNAAPQPVADERAISAAPQLAKHQPCGCVICTCEDPERCQGCGAKHCGTHPLGEIPHPVYEGAPSVQPVADEREAFEVAMLKFDWRNFEGSVQDGFWYYDNSDLNARWVGWRECARSRLASPPLADEGQEQSADGVQPSDGGRP